ncbi:MULTISPECIES: hypothetical protein [unclassified Luteococcus]|uniref:hypothetical protein n=1 Tax=unclassified Luteococcus TaxID=2639923 RepID=UPI00313C6E26
MSEPVFFEFASVEKARAAVSTATERNLHVELHDDGGPVRVAVRQQDLEELEVTMLRHGGHLREPQQGA